MRLHAIILIDFLNMRVDKNRNRKKSFFPAFLVSPLTENSKQLKMSPLIEINKIHEYNQITTTTLP